ncbi:MAG: insulinase family protein, partial [Planctomycetota bacterium]
RASLGGTWSTGSLDQARERQALTDLDEAWQETMRRPGPESSAKVRTCDEAARALSDDLAFARVLAAAPAHRPEILDRRPAGLLLLTTVAAAIADVGKLLVERREQQVLRNLAQIWMSDLIERIRIRSMNPALGVRAELLTLAMPNHPAGRSFEPPSYQAPQRDQALGVWQATQRPERSVHVLLGDFDPVVAEAALRRTFATTVLPPYPLDKYPDSTPLPPRPIAGVRRSIVPGTQRPMVAIAWLLPPIADRFVLEGAAHWLGRGVDSQIGQALQRAGRTSASVSCEAPWPEVANGRSLLLLEIQDGNGTDGLADSVLSACREVVQQPPSAAALQGALVAMQRRWGALTEDPRELAAEVAKTALLWPEHAIVTQCPDHLDAKLIQALLASIFSGHPVLVEGRP